jgi:hypothetical protein
VLRPEPAHRGRLLRDFPTLRHLTLNLPDPAEAKAIVAMAELIRLERLELTGVMSAATW